MRPFTLVTGNSSKLEEAHRILAAVAADVEIDHADVDLPEIQSLDLIEVLRAKAAEAWSRLGRPLVVEETGLELAALGGFPGPFVKWMLAAVGPEGVARTAIALGDPRATARCAVLLHDGERQVIGAGEDHGRLVLPPRGEDGFGWDPVFQPLGEDRTYAELGMDAKDATGHRGRAWRDLVAKLGTS
jgi:non-canonical purine NTP pyrophosphatase (RdgB/HAM1 family)